MSMLGQRRARGDDTVYVRATPQKVELTETYAVDQEISRNPTIEQVGDGAGRIEATVPYDGYEFFTRQAVADVERALGARGAPGERRATIGHLLLADHTNTSGLRNVMRPHGQAGLVPLSIPVADRDGTLDLSGGRQASVVTLDYQPENPPVYPVALTVELDDLDTLTGTFDTMQTLMTRGRENPSLVIERLQQEASFSSALLLTFRVKIAIPVKAGYPALRPSVTDMSVEWPTLTSMRSTELYIENFGGKPDQRIRRAPVRYNPVKGRLEWKAVPMREVKEGGPGNGAGTRVFLSANCLLKIGHPGELFDQDQLEVTARVRVPDYLLSGMEARLYDATGHPQRTQPKLATKLNVRTMVYPADIFAGRAFSPYHQFVVDDILPDEKRITDVVTVLRNSRFTVDEPRPKDPQDPLAPTWLVVAHRSQGPDSLDLLVAVEGERTTQGHKQLLRSDYEVSGIRDSGRLKVSVMATLPRDHRELTREINAFQSKLRERYHSHQLSRKSAGS
ncbi:hypothetical protein ACQEVZ_23240 [Dactylosporangium sp. CA-152071]|uniref:hypothetical protein n=1 Tax=Dactylosporangium sp. CA-152071 TaxID=3239933 RepID=UPI003D8F2E03